MQPEIELKLELSPEAATRFCDWAPLPDDHSIAALHATYFDTPDHLLAAQGISLRIRRSGRRRVQTVKAGGRRGAGLFSRDEWERSVRGVVPVLDDGNPVAALLGDAVGTVGPVFDVRVDRRTWMIRDGDALIELVLDRGVVQAGEREAPVCEIELELKAGAPAALFALARRIDGDIPVRPGVLTKAERGYRLSRDLQQAFKAQPIEIAPGTSIGHAFAQIAADCLRQYRLNEAALIDRYTPQALHQARVAIRRLRSALTLFAPVLAADDVDRFQGELRWLAGALGEARDLDVLIEGIADPAQAARLEAVRADVRDRALQWLDSARVRALLIDLVEWLAMGAGCDARAEAPAAPFAAMRMAKFRKRIARRGRHMARLSDEARHAVRKDAKKLRYGTEFFAGLFDAKKGQRRRRKRFVRSLARMQGDLGALNDLASAPSVMARYGLAPVAMPDARDRAALIAKAAQAQADFADRRRFWK